MCEQLSYFVLKTFSVVQQNTTMFFADVKICDFPQLFYMNETSRMIGVKVVTIDVLYQPAKFCTTFLEHPV